MNHKKVEVYTATSFSDLLASPVFYSTAAIAFVLGAFSILGFLQTPQKLKSTVDKITQKVVVLEQKELDTTVSVASVELEKGNVSFRNRNHVSGFSRSISEEVLEGIKPVSFNYDITSKHFWNDLESNTSMPEVVRIEDKTKADKDSLLFGTPVESDYLEDNDSRYSLKLSSKIKI